MTPSLPIAIGTLISGAMLCGAAEPRYTIGVNSFRPANTDLFIAAADGSNAQPLLAHEALDYNASFSFDGRWVVFTSERNGTADVYRARIDGSGLERLTDHPAFDDQGALSPDGSRLAFVSSRSGQADIWVMDLRTRALRNLTSVPSGEFRPAWSPDGQWIAFSSDRDPPHASCAGRNGTRGPGAFVTPQYTAVFVMRADGSAMRRISVDGEVAGSPAWSTDGRAVLFHAAPAEEICLGGLMFATGTSQIIAVNLVSGARRSLTAGDGLKMFPTAFGQGELGYAMADGIVAGKAGSGSAGSFGRPDWSPDGSRMVFHRDLTPGQGIRPGSPLASHDPRFRLVSLPGHSAFSPDGSRIAFVMQNFSAGSPTNGSVVVANADGSDRRVLFDGPDVDNITAPAWSPQGDAIVFGQGAYLRRVETGPARLMRLSPRGGTPVPLTGAEVNAGMPNWSPDGERLIYRVAEGPKRGLRVLDLRTGADSSVATGSDRDTFPSWSPRGDWITFTSQRDGDYEIYVARPDGTQARRLTRTPGADAHSSISPDGEWVAFATAQQGFKDEALGFILGARPPQFQAYGEIAVMRIDGSEMQVLTDNAIEDGVPVWVPRQLASGSSLQRND